MMYVDRDKMFRQFGEHLKKHILQAQNELLQDSVAGMQTPEGKGDLWAEKVEIAAYIITARIMGGPWALIDEWGKGSLMDTSNPALAAYRTSTLWNPARHDLKIRTRPKGAYRDFFGRIRVAKGPGGRDIEAALQAMPSRFRDEMADYGPKPPSHAVKTAVRWLQQGRFQVIVRGAIGTFPWHIYMVVKNTKRGGSP